VTEQQARPTAQPVDLGHVDRLCDHKAKLRQIEQWAREDEDSYADTAEHARIVAALKAGADALEALPRMRAELRAARENERRANALYSAARAELRAAREVAGVIPPERLRLLAHWLDLHDDMRQHQGIREAQKDLRRLAAALDAYDQATQGGA
jgi:hypothetical protein